MDAAQVLGLVSLGERPEAVGILERIGAMTNATEFVAVAVNDHVNVNVNVNDHVRPRTTTST